MGWGVRGICRNVATTMFDVVWGGGEHQAASTARKQPAWEGRKPSSALMQYPT